ncbi:hypothetical protein [Ramlibacter sp.]|uniref:hypothetical protein n=1 Tax=Ramlibacter sp. TaxID=1917967 RepID=UPI003D0ABCE1
MTARQAPGATPAVTPVEIGGRAFELRDLAPEDGAELRRLHVDVFGDGADAAWYDWKYRRGGGLGSGMWHEGRLIAHCGGVPRALHVEGERRGGIQIGDVMVATAWRGVLTRRGPFFHVSDAFYRAHVGEGTPHAIAFGFPSERHLRLAVKTGLLHDGGPVQGLSWMVPSALPDPATTDLPWTWRWVPLDAGSPEFDRSIEQAWDTMSRATREFVVGERTPAYVRWRFFERPARSSRAFVLRRAWSRRARGVAILDLASDPADAKWLDWIGDPADAPLACRASLAEAARAKATSLSAWATTAVTQSLRDTGMAAPTVTAWLGIPCRSALDAADVPRLRWWLMGGDTDFL